METKKQKLLIQYLISSTDTFALCSGIIKANYFDPEFRSSVQFIQDYYDKYNTTPNSSQVEAETGVELQQQTINPDKVEYCADEIETFCKHQGMKKAILDSVELVGKGDYGKVEELVREAVTISLNRELGVRYFEDVDERLQRMLRHNPTEPTGWTEVDKLLFGGISRKEMLLVSANSGGGKSITLANLGFNFLNRMRNVLIISLELDADIIAQRFDTMFTGVSRRDWSKRVNEISTRVTSQKDNCGILDIVQMPSGTKALEIRAYLKEYYLHYNMLPDLLILDYLDEMEPNQFVSADNIWEKDRRCATQFRQIGVDYNMFTATASQLNRGAVNALRHDHSHIAGGISKINIADTYWSIVQTEKMKASGEIQFELQKTRNSDGVGKIINLKWDSKHLRILDRDDDRELVFNRKEAPNEEVSEGGDKLLEFIKSNTL